MRSAASAPAVPYSPAYTCYLLQLAHALCRQQDQPGAAQPAGECSTSQSERPGTGYPTAESREWRPVDRGRRDCAGPASTSDRWPPSSCCLFLPLVTCKSLKAQDLEPSSWLLAPPHRVVSRLAAVVWVLTWYHMARCQALGGPHSATPLPAAERAASHAHMPLPCLNC